MKNPGILNLIRLALEEDIGDGDHTTLACIDPNITGQAELLVKQQGTLAGVEVAGMVFSTFDRALKMEVVIPDGSQVAPGDRAFMVTGPKRSILQTERLVLNFMQRMSGIATQTAKYVASVSGTKARILDTRKTSPNLRWFEKEAVRLGGGLNHRMGLYDMVMIKDNHIDFSGGIRQAVDKTIRYLNDRQLNLSIEVEARNLSEVTEILKTGSVHRILLDNMTPAQVAEAVLLIDGRVETEASGGIDLKNVREYALAGVDFISVGALTHQLASLDLSLKAKPT